MGACFAVKNTDRRIRWMDVPGGVRNLVVIAFYTASEDDKQFCLPSWVSTVNIIISPAYKHRFRRADARTTERGSLTYYDLTRDPYPCIDDTRQLGGTADPHFGSDPSGPLAGSCIVAEVRCEIAKWCKTLRPPFEKIAKLPLGGTVLGLTGRPAESKMVVLERMVRFTQSTLLGRNL